MLEPQYLNIINVVLAKVLDERSDARQAIKASCRPRSAWRMLSSFDRWDRVGFNRLDSSKKSELDNVFCHKSHRILNNANLRAAKVFNSGDNPLDGSRYCNIVTIRIRWGIKQM